MGIYLSSDSRHRRIPPEIIHCSHNSLGVSYKEHGQNSTGSLTQIEMAQHTDSVAQIENIVSLYLVVKGKEDT